MKILDLFNEYNLSPEMTWWEMEQPRTEKDWNAMSRIYKAYIVSRDFWWIKWLVDNEKIDFNFVERIWSWDFIYDMTGNPYYNSCTCEDLEEYGDVDRVLMLLAIQDEPIEFLISILK